MTRGQDNLNPCKCSNPSCMERLASHYPLENLSPELRMIAFMHAIGHDVSGYFDDRNAQPEYDEVDFDDIRDEVLRPTRMKFDTATKYRYRTKR